MSLNDKQRRFVNEYLIDLNATQAAIRAGYSPKTAYSHGDRLLKDIEIKKLIGERMSDREQRTEITQDRVLQELAKLAFLDIRKAFDSDGALKGIHELDDDTAAAVAGLDVIEMSSEDDKTCRLKKVKLSDKRAALELIGRHLGMYKDKLEVVETSYVQTVPESESVEVWAARHK